MPRASKKPARRSSRATRSSSPPTRPRSTSAATCSSTTAPPATAPTAAAPSAFPTSPTTTGCGAAMPTSWSPVSADGRKGVMPPWGEVLGARGVEDMLSYVLGLTGRKLKPATPRAGKAKYDELCVGLPRSRRARQRAAGCAQSHRRLSGCTAARWRAVRDSIEKGRMGAMPAHAERLGETRVRLLAAYVLSLSQAALMNSPPRTERHPRAGRTRRARWARSCGASFLAAALAWCCVSPLSTRRASPPTDVPDVVDHATCGYALGFFLFWLVGLARRGPVLAARAAGTPWQLKSDSGVTAPEAAALRRAGEDLSARGRRALRAAASVVGVGAARHLLPVAVAATGTTGKPCCSICPRASSSFSG